MAWLSITEYAVLNKTSPSTIRRHIRDNSIQFKLENGKYYLLDEKSNDSLSDKDKTIRALKEEISELKMLISILEKQKNT